MRISSMQLIVIFYQLSLFTFINCPSKIMIFILRVRIMFIQDNKYIYIERQMRFEDYDINHASPRSRNTESYHMQKSEFVIYKSK